MLQTRTAKISNNREKRLAPGKRLLRDVGALLSKRFGNRFL